MNIGESIKIALASIWNHKIRSLLTMLGIIIGVCAVIVIVAIGTGAKNQITEDLFSADKNKVELYYEPFMEEDTGEEIIWEEPELTEADLDALQSLPGVKIAIGTNSTWNSAIYDDKQMELEITGVGRDYFYGRNIKLLEGRYFATMDIDNVNRALMIDDYTRDKLFRDKDAIGEIIEVEGNPYKIIGVYISTTPPEYRWDDSGEALMPRSTVSMMHFTPEIDEISVFAQSPEQLVETAELAAAHLTELKELENGHFTYWNMDEWEEEFASFYTTITLFIGSIASISLLVGGIGVMNIMLVSVTERTREIGLRKALGATRSRILLQFLIEAMTLTLLGGLIGIGIAVLGVTIAGQVLPFTPTVSPIIALVGASFSALIGVVFGILPANKASKLSPIDALRHE